MNKEYIVLSLFDGHSGAQISLKEQSIPVSKYYASEVDKFAITQTQHVFPNTIQLGDVRDVDVSKLDKIDILFGGSPCTDLSFAGKQSGLIMDTFGDYMELREEYLITRNEKLYFHNDKFQQSILFWEYLRILKELRKINPDVKFLLENVGMTKKNQLKFNENLGLMPVVINSNLVSAQNRHRLYWSNIKTRQEGLWGELITDIPQPKDEGILLKDILQPESEVDEKYYINSHKFKEWFEDDIVKLDKKGNIKPDQNKASCFTAGGNSGGNHSDMDILCVAMRGRESFCMTPKRTEHGKAIRKDYESGKIKEQRKNIQQLEPREDGKTNTISTVQKDNLIMTKNYIQWDTSGKGYKSQQDRAFYENGKHGSLAASRAEDKNGVLTNNYKLRRLTPIECTRLQTIPFWYDWSVSSDTQIYKMCGNGWTIKAIQHILSFLQQ